MPRLHKLMLLTALYAGVVTALGIGFADWVAEWAATRGGAEGASTAAIRDAGPWLFAVPIAAYAAVALRVGRRGLPLRVSQYAAAVLLGALLTPVLFLLSTIGAISLYGLWAMPRLVWAVLIYGAMALPGGLVALLLALGRGRAAGPA